MSNIYNLLSVPDHEGGIIWLTGLSGSGKSTLAKSLEHALLNQGYTTCILDGDKLRQGLTSDLGFSSADRAENIRRIAEVATLFATAGSVCIVSVISPLAEHRNKARRIAAALPFYEVYISADIETCKKRDPKGLYKKALRGDIPEFTGISAPYEAPTNPDLTVNTAQLTHDASHSLLLEFSLGKFPIGNLDSM